MPVNGFSVGRDYSIVLATSDGIKRMALITGFDAKPQTTKIKVKGMDGITRHAVFHEGWAGSFNVERQGNDLEEYWAKLEQDYHDGVNLEPSQITETITEADGSTNQYRYENVIITLEDTGDRKGNDTLKQKVSFEASRRILI